MTRTVFRCLLVILAVGAFMGGYFTREGQEAAVVTPAACVYAGHPLPSGDAVSEPNGREEVCTDGTWVPVAGYGVKG